ncbi:MAG TPA: hypothetical protein VFS24_07440 [Steroidobacteraceae bacterium]|nr:hypothetical protein [Steroidobacteraceae bacterium]
MSDGQYFGYGILAAILGACGLILWITREVKKGPGKKPNIRVPRETLWARTNRYHGESK